MASVTLVERMRARRRPEAQLGRLFAGGWPAFIGADRTTARYIDRVREWYADLELVLPDEGHVLVAAGWAVPVRWSGDVEDLPSGYAGSLVRAVEGKARGVVPDTLVICAAQVRSDLHGRGLAGQLLTAMRAPASQRKVPTNRASSPPTGAARSVIDYRCPHAGALAEQAWSVQHNLSFYDALYVALAARLGLPLVTGDRRLSHAATARAG